MTLLTAREVDVLFRYPAGRTLRLAKAGRIPSIHLPDGEIRFDADQIAALLTPQIQITLNTVEVTHAAH